MTDPHAGPPSMDDPITGGWTPPEPAQPTPPVPPPYSGPAQPPYPGPAQAPYPGPAHPPYPGPSPTQPHGTAPPGLTPPGLTPPAPARVNRLPLIIGGAVVAAAVIVTLIVILVGGGGPKATVNDFLSKAKDNDMAAASQDVCAFLRPIFQVAGSAGMFADATGVIQDWSITDVTETASSARVTVSLVLSRGGSTHTETSTFDLIKEDGAWVICG